MAIFYTILFSLSEPKQNLYIQMLTLQLASLRRTGTLRPTDRYIIITEPKTADYLKRSCSALGSVEILLASRPRSALQGMFLKYILPTLIDVGDELCFYLDLDILSVRRLDLTAASCPPDTLLVLPEGPPTDPNYCGSTPLRLPAGLSAGLFLYRYGPRVAEIFKGVYERILSTRTRFYTLDQPHFNHAVAAAPAGAAAVLNPKLVSFNGHTNRDTAVLFNMCGEPADGPFHFQKLLDTFVRVFVSAQ